MNIDRYLQDSRETELNIWKNASRDVEFPAKNGKAFESVVVPYGENGRSRVLFRSKVGGSIEERFVSSQNEEDYFVPPRRNGFSGIIEDGDCDHVYQDGKFVGTLFKMLKPLYTGGKINLPPANLDNIPGEIEIYPAPEQLGGVVY